jgi:hypothetical protein
MLSRTAFLPFAELHPYIFAMPTSSRPMPAMIRTMQPTLAASIPRGAGQRYARPPPGAIRRATCAHGSAAALPQAFGRRGSASALRGRLRQDGVAEILLGLAAGHSGYARSADPTNAPVAYSGAHCVRGRMPCYRLSPKHPFDGDTYWLLAATPEEARRLVARNVPQAATANDMRRWACVLDASKSPPGSVIVCALQEPVAVTCR